MNETFQIDIAIRICYSTSEYWTIKHLPDDRDGKEEFGLILSNEYQSTLIKYLGKRSALALSKKLVNVILNGKDVMDYLREKDYCIRLVSKTNMTMLKIIEE